MRFIIFKRCYSLCDHLNMQSKMKQVRQRLDIRDKQSRRQSLVLRRILSMRCLGEELERRYYKVAQR